MRSSKAIGSFFTVLLLVICLGHPAFATPPAMPPTWDNPVTAYIVFPAGRSPDENNRFEIEVYCAANYDIEQLSLEVDHSEEITFDEELPHFEGPMKKGESKVYRIKGTVNNAVQMDDFKMPASAQLIINYRFPKKAILEDIENRQAQYDSGWNDYALRELERVKDENITILKAIPVKQLSPKEE